MQDWWNQVWDCQFERGDDVSTLTPEYGPPPYARVEGTMEASYARVGAICDRQSKRQRARFAAKRAAKIGQTDLNTLPIIDISAFIQQDATVWCHEGELLINLRMPSVKLPLQICTWLAATMASFT